MGKSQFTLLLAACASLFVACGESQQASESSPNKGGTTPPSGSNECVSSSSWSINQKPVITIGEELGNDWFWNDPTVIVDGGGFRMWLSGGDPKLWPINASVYEAFSLDGVTWQISPKAVLEPSTIPGDFDDLRIETPSVIKVDGTYHMYYSGKRDGDPQGVYRIGHATSKNGTQWVKDPGNPVVDIPPSVSPLEWGNATAAEPGIVYNSKDGVFYLYYVALKAASASQLNVPLYGILLATSKDGSSFTSVLEEGSRKNVMSFEGYELVDGYHGFSTPSGYIDAEGVFHLYYDVIHDDGSGAGQRFIAHATSMDGQGYTEVERDIISTSGPSWRNVEVRAPSVVEKDGERLMWFAANGEVPSVGGLTWPEVEAGVGLATNQFKCLE